MASGFTDVLASAADDRLDLFLTTALRLGTPIQNVEKDFWVCWVINLLFNEAADDEPRLLFKGGTSLSKSYGLISRFSEDVDITVFREDLGQTVTVEELEFLSGKKQRAHLSAIKSSCQQFISTTLKTRLTKSIQAAFNDAELPEMNVSLRRDYSAMAGMIFGVVPPWEDVVKSVTNFENRINQSKAHCL